MEGGKPRVIPNRDGARMTPTVVAVTSEDRRLVGQAAKVQAANNPRGTIFDIPRLLGRRFDSVEIQQAQRRLPYQIVEAENLAPTTVEQVDLT